MGKLTILIFNLIEIVDIILDVNIYRKKKSTCGNEKKNSLNVLVHLASDESQFSENFEPILMAHTCE